MVTQFRKMGRFDCIQIYFEREDDKVCDLTGYEVWEKKITKNESKVSGLNDSKNRTAIYEDGKA